MSSRIREQLERYLHRSHKSYNPHPLKERLDKLTKARSDFRVNFRMRLGGEWIQEGSVMKFVHSEPFSDAILDKLSGILGIHTDTGLKLSEMAFIDIETTGNNMGVGTLVFLVGICYIRHSSLIAEQYLLTSVDSEEGFLKIIRDELGKFNVFASYNGRSFDIPFLLGRFWYHRISSPEIKHHIDLYHLTKRIFASPGGYRLTEIEKYLLRRVRDVDISSNLIPHAFFRFIKTSDTRPLRLAISHNRYDITSLPLLTVRLENMLNRPKILYNGETLYKIGKMYFSLKEYTKAEEYLTTALKTADGSQKVRVLRLLGRLYKRQKRYHNALEAWLRITQENGSDQEANRELAILHEHRFKDFETAYYFARKLDSSLLDTQRRIRRLEKKLKPPLFSPKGL